MILQLVGNGIAVGVEVSIVSLVVTSGGKFVWSVMMRGWLLGKLLEMWVMMM